MHSHSRKSVRVLAVGLSAIGLFVLAACEAPTAGDEDVNVDVHDSLNPQGPPTGATYSVCQPVQVKGFQTQNFAVANPFVGNSRLALVSKASKLHPTPNVPCVNVETLQNGTCSFFTDQSHIHLKYDPVKHVGNTGSWLLGGDGNIYAQAGQRVDPTGTVEGDWVVAATISEKGTVPCVPPKGRDSAGTAPGSELAGSCIIETMLASQNKSTNYLKNVATVPVCTGTYPHPDKAVLVSQGVGFYCYKADGAGLNDLNGTERDYTGVYLPGSDYCHVAWNGPLEVLAAKRPATKTIPYPGKVSPTTEFVWRPVDDRVPIANP